MIVADLVVEPVVRIAADATLREAACCLAEVGGVVLVDAEPLGELTEHDVVVAISRGADAATPVAEIARPAPAFVGRDARVDIVASYMISEGRRTLAVVDDTGRPIGVISLRDVASALWGGTSLLGALRDALHVREDI